MKTAVGLEYTMLVVPKHLLAFQVVSPIARCDHQTQRLDPVKSGAVLVAIALLVVVLFICGAVGKGGATRE